MTLALAAILFILFSTLYTVPSFTQLEAKSPTTTLGVAPRETSILQSSHPGRTSRADQGKSTYRQQSPNRLSATCSAAEEVPITITNSQPTPTPGSFQQMLVVNTPNYASYINSAWSNVGFQFPSGAGVPVWIESGASNAATSTTVWIDVGTIPASSSINLVMVIYSTTCNLLSASGPVGEAPTLSPAYGEYDNGATVFSFYDNFAGRTLSSVWDNTTANPIVVDNGLTVAGANTGSPAIQTASYSQGAGIVDFDATIPTGASAGGNCVTTLGVSTAGNMNTNLAGVGIFCGGRYGLGTWSSSNSGNIVTGLAWGTENIYSLVIPSTTPSSISAEVNYGGVISSTNNLPALPEPIIIGNQYGNGVTTTVQWVRAREYPPNGVMPSASLGALMGAVNAGPVSPSPVTIDSGQSITLSANPSGGFNPYTYQWSAGSSTACSQNTPISGATGITYVASPTVLTYYCYVVTDKEGVSSPSPVGSVAVNPALSVSTISPSSPTIDKGQTVVLTENPAGGTPPYTYQWYAGSSCTSPLSGATKFNLSVSPVTTTTYSVLVNDTSTIQASQCSSGDLVTVNPTLSAGIITPKNPNIDAGQSVTLVSAPSGGTSPYRYQWYDGSSCVSPISGATASAFPASPTTMSTYTVLVTDSSSAPSSQCSSSTVVSVNPKLIADPITPSAPTIDVGQSVQLNAVQSGGTAPFFFSWYTGVGCTGAIPGATGSAYVAAPTTATTYYYRVNDSAYSPSTACSMGDTVTVKTVGPVPTLGSVQVSPSSIALGPGALQTFTASAVDTNGTVILSGVTFSWSLSPVGIGTLNPNLGAVVTVTAGSLPMNGTLLVTATLGNVTKSYSVPITVSSTSSPLVIQSFVSSPSTVDLGNQVSFTVLVRGGTGAFTYVYSALPPGCPSPPTNASTFGCTPSSVGSYDVNVTVSDVAGDRASANLTLIVISAPPSASSGGWNWVPIVWGIIFLIALVVVVVLLLFFMRRPASEAGDPIGPPPPTNDSPVPPQPPLDYLYGVTVPPSVWDEAADPTVAYGTFSLDSTEQREFSGTIRHGENIPVEGTASESSPKPVLDGSQPFSLKITPEGIEVQQIPRTVDPSSIKDVEFGTLSTGKGNRDTGHVSGPTPNDVYAVMQTLTRKPRSLDGIKQEVRLDDSSLLEVLGTLSKARLVARGTKTSSESTVFVLTPLGQKMARRFIGTQGSGWGQGSLEAPGQKVLPPGKTAKKRRAVRLSKDTSVQDVRRIGKERGSVEEETPFKSLRPEDVNPQLMGQKPLSKEVLQPMEMRVQSDRGTDSRNSTEVLDSEKRTQILMERAKKERKEKDKFGVEQTSKPDEESHS